MAEVGVIAAASFLTIANVPTASAFRLYPDVCSEQALRRQWVRRFVW